DPVLCQHDRCRRHDGINQPVRRTRPAPRQHAVSKHLHTPRIGRKKQISAPNGYRQTWYCPSGETLAFWNETTSPVALMRKPAEVSSIASAGTGAQSRSEQHSMGYQECAKAPVATMNA